MPDYLGQYEATIAQSYTRAANLRSMLHKSNCPPALLHIDTFFARLVNQSHSGAFIDLAHLSGPPDIHHSHKWNGKAQRLSDELNVALRRSGISVSQGIHSSRLTINGVFFTTEAEHHGNSQIVAKSGSDGGAATPATIESILQVEHSSSIQTALAIRRLKPFHAVNDPFSQYPLLHLSLHRSERSPLEIVSPDSVLSHFSSLKIIWEAQEVLIVNLLDRT
jgi:hypothetical protein